ncbi:MAG: ferritin family protein [Thermoplasmata archaeon]|nr:ferritin family protein [Staphylococcus epidermidis]
MANLKELLEMALRAEIDSNNIYNEYSERVKNSILKEKFKFLANEESKHKVLIENIIKMKFPGEEITVPESTEVPLPVIKISENDPISKLLIQAMNVEKETSKFYENIAKNLDYETGALMRYLSAVEMSHYYFLEAEKELALRFEDYDQYFEMMHVGP